MFWRKMTRCLLAALLIAISAPAYSQEGASTIAREISILAKQNLALHNRPDFYSNVLSLFMSGDDLTAFGRDATGEWLQTPDGWVNARNAAADGDIMDLEITTDFISLQATGNRQLREGPDASFSQTATLPAGKLTIAVGRNHDGAWIQTPGGWLPSGEIETDGDIRSLPVTFASVTIRAAKNGAFLNAPTWEANVLDIFERGDEAFAHKRTADSRWVRTPKGWLSLSQGMDLQGDLEAVRVEPIVTVTFVADTGIFAHPQASAEAVGSAQKGQSAIALRRTEDGLWLEIPFGWVLSDAVEESADLEGLSLPPDGIPITPRNYSSVIVRNGPSNITNRIGVVKQGEEEIAIGRSANNKWLMISGGGWVFALYMDADGDSMMLPVTDGSAGSTSRVSTARATATPRPATRSTSSSSNWTSSTIRNLVSRHTDDIRILDLELGSSVTTIEYDLKPWPFVPNEQIANEVAFKIICALRRGQQIPNTLKLIGQGHFKSDIGRKFKSPSVEIHIRANNANRIICAGNSYSDINWRSVSSVYKSYPIPRGAKVDYD